VAAQEIVQAQGLQKQASTHQIARQESARALKRASQAGMMRPMNNMEATRRERHSLITGQELLQGYLSKCDKFGKRWKRRWFVLSENCVEYFVSKDYYQKRAMPKGRVQLNAHVGVRKQVRCDCECTCTRRHTS
jgi:hypothetical protein